MCNKFIFSFSDFQPPSGLKLAFSPGQTSKCVTFTIIDDKLVESEEEFSITLVPEGANLESGKGKATVTITDNDKCKFAQYNV